MIVYHGSDMAAEAPDVLHSSRNLDFGPGFYVTTVRPQAERWAKRKALLNGKGTAVLNIYDFRPCGGFAVKDFGDDLESWLDFVCKCRSGDPGYQAYDVIIGKVADDKVFRVVDLYRRGIWDRERAVREMRVYETYDQIAFITQSALDAMLTFKAWETVADD